MPYDIVAGGSARSDVRPISGGGVRWRLGGGDVCGVKEDEGRFCREGKEEPWDVRGGRRRRW